MDSWHLSDQTVSSKGQKSCQLSADHQQVKFQLGDGLRTRFGASTFDKNVDAMKPGFLTAEDLSSIDLKGHVAVYMPHSYNFSGNIFIVPKENVIPVNIPSVDFMKFIVSGGITHFKNTDSIKEDIKKETK